MTPTARLVRRIVLVLACALVAALVVSATPALTAISHPYEGELKPGGSVAVDDFSGDVLVAHSGSGTVSVYNSADEPIEEWTGLCTPGGSFGRGTLHIAANNATGYVYVADFERQVVDILDSTGACHGQLTGAAGQSWQVVAVDQANGSVYVTTNGSVSKFSSSGVFQSELSTPLGFTYQIFIYGVAVDDFSGKVLVTGNTIVNGESKNLVFVYDAATGAFETTWYGSAATNSPGTPNGSFGATGTVTVAADNSTGGIYVATKERVPNSKPTQEPLAVEELDSAGRYLGQITGTPSGPFAEPTNLAASLGDVAFGQATGRIYVWNATAVDVFGPPPKESAPVVSSESAFNVTSDSAGLRAQINPGHLPTTYHFEYGTDTSYGLRVPASDAQLGSGENDLTASVQLSGLAPDTTYHYRVVATNALGPTDGPDRIFTTFELAHPFALPDNRAYEMVSPPDKSDGEVNNHEGSTVGDAAAQDGDRMTYFSASALPGSAAGLPGQYLASRAPGGWSSQNLIPASHTIGTGPCAVGYDAFSLELTSGVLEDGAGKAAECKDEPPLVEGEPQNVTNLFLRDTISGSYSLLSAPQSGFAAGEATFAGATPDLGHVLFWSTAHFSAGAIDGHPNLYESARGIITLVSRLPRETAVETVYPGDGGALGGLESHQLGVISEDGSRVYWTPLGPLRYLYLREGIGTSQERTVQVDASHGAGPGGGGRFMAASIDGSRAFFTDNASAGLTADTVPGSGANLYEYDTKRAGTLTDLTPVGQAEVLGLVAIGRDGSYVYFVAKGALAAGAMAGQPNLYLAHEGTITFIATLAPGDSKDWTATPSRGERITPDGVHLAFDSLLSLTGHDNRDVKTGQADNEIYLYDAEASPAERLRCASCNPSGAAPLGSSDFNSTLPTEEQNWYSVYTPRNLSGDGSRLFFDSGDALVLGDTNSQRDVYEWESDGTGSCAREGGCVSLISSGTSESGSHFLDASANGNDVFFATAQALLPQDGDSALDVYDARVCTAADRCIAPPPSPSPPCSGEACRGPLGSPPSPLMVGSITLSGSGNLTPPVSRSLTPAQKRAKALRSCRKRYKKSKTRRATCERQAKKRYASTARRANHNTRSPPTSRGR